MLQKLETGKDRVLLRNARVLDVRAGSLNTPANVLVKSGVIADMDAGKSSVDCDVIECDGLTLSPGLIDCHCHILSPFIAEQKGLPGLWMLRQIRRNFAAMLATGVVCVRDMLSPIKFMNYFRDSINEGKIPGPRILAAGPVLSCKGGYPQFIEPVPALIAAFIGQPKLHLDTPQEAASAIRDLKKCGVDIIKVGYTHLNADMEPDNPLPVISGEVFDAICKTAHSLGLKVGVHHFCAQDLSEILRHDVDSIEHLPFDRALSSDEIAFVKKHGVRVVPTLTMTESVMRFEEKSEFLNSAWASDIFEPNVLQYLKSVAASWLDFSDPNHLKSFGVSRGRREFHKYVMRNAIQLREAGVPISTGTDMGAVTSFPGETADEVRRLSCIGLSNPDAIRAATLKAAELLGVEDKIGAVEPGKNADVILIEGNPLDDIDAVKRIRYVGKGGCWYQTKHPEAPDFWHGFELVMKDAG